MQKKQPPIAIQGYSCHRCGKWHQLPEDAIKRWNETIEVKCDCGATTAVKRGTAKAIR